MPSLYPGSSSRLRFCCLHKHMIDRRLRPSDTRSDPSREVRPPLAAAVLDALGAKLRRLLDIGPGFAVISGILIDEMTLMQAQELAPRMLATVGRPLLQ